MEKLNISDIEKLFKSHNAILLSEWYEGIKDKLWFRCSCGGEGKVSVISVKVQIKKNKNYEIKCRECQKEIYSRIKKEKSLLGSKIKEIINFQGGVFLEYTHLSRKENKKTRTRFICSGCKLEAEKNIRSKDINKITKYVSMCKKCSSSIKQRGRESTRKLTIEQIRERFKQASVKLISDEANGNQDQYKFMCDCGNIGEIIYSTLDRRIKKLKKYKVKCRDCRILENTKSGEDHPRYNKDLTDEERQSRKDRPNEVKRWYKKIFRMFDYTCVITGIRKVSLSAHHLYSYADHPEKRLNIENGICISKELHMEFHKKYGRGKNTPQQFTEFYKNKTGEHYVLPHI